MHRGCAAHLQFFHVDGSFVACFYRGAAMFPDALEEAGRVEGLPLSSLQTLPELEEETAAPGQMGPKRRGRYRQSLQLLKPFRITHK